MNENEKLICCPECTVKYPSYHNLCPKCGAPKPITPDVIKAEERQNITPTITATQPVPNTTIQQQPTYVVPVAAPIPGYNQTYNQNYNYNNYNYNNQQPIDMQYETSKSIKILMTLSTTVFIITIIATILLALIYLIGLSSFGVLEALIIIALVPGSIFLGGLILSQTLKWKALMLYHTQNNKCNCNQTKNQNPNI